MGSPIRCLDELYVSLLTSDRVVRASADHASDVFMDNVNRDVSLRMMVSESRPIQRHRV